MKTINIFEYLLKDYTEKEIHDVLEHAAQDGLSIYSTLSLGEELDKNNEKNKTTRNN